MKNPPHTRIPETDPSVSIFKITRNQLNTLKSKSNNGPHSTTSYSSFELLAAHVWRCICKARGLADDQQIKLYIPVDARTRFDPALPPGYFGNAIFMATLTVAVGDLTSNPLIYAATRINDALERMDDEYLRSQLDFLELQSGPTATIPGVHMFRSHAMNSINSWYRLPIYDADFGWGKPIFMGPGAIGFPGLAILIPNPIDDGSLSLVISLEPDHMGLFKKYLYDI